jgi:hypothetical protein
MNIITHFENCEKDSSSAIYAFVLLTSTCVYCIPFHSSIGDRSRRLTPSITNNTHKWSIVNRLIYIAYYTSLFHMEIISIFYSQNTHDTLQYKISRSFVTCYISCVYGTCSLPYSPETAQWQRQILILKMYILVYTYIEGNVLNTWFFCFLEL